jgi:hypothetical protein
MISSDLLRPEKKSALLVFFVLLFSASHATAADYIYLHCNATGWDLSPATQMTEAGSPGKYEIIYDVAQNWMTKSGDNCIVVRTGVHNQWTSDVMRLTGNTTQSVPFTDPLLLAGGSTPFTIVYPELGSYRATVNWADKTLLVEHLLPEGDVAERQNGYFIEPSADMFVFLPGTYAGSPYWRYTTELPASGWHALDFDDSNWSSGQAGFGSSDGMPGDNQRTVWPAEKNRLWLRSSFYVASSDDINELMLWARWDDVLSVYINGTLAAQEPGWSPGYRYLGISESARNQIGVGINTISIHVADIGGGKYFDLGIVKNEALTDRPMSGSETTPALAAFTSTIKRFMVEHGITAGQATVIKDDQVVLARGLGWSDRELTAPINTDAIMRLASNDKPITAAVMRHLISTATVDPVSGQTITADTRVFPLLQQHGLMPLTGMSTNPESDAITVAQLLDHRGGLPELPSPEDLYNALGVEPGMSSAQDNVSWLFTQGPEFTPGSEYRYSSSGYMVLRYLIEKVTGSFMDYTWAVLHDTTSNSAVYIASEREKNRMANEPWYVTFEQPYDRWIYLENYYALASTSEALARVAARFNLFTGEPLPAPGSGANAVRVFIGAYSGTWSVNVQRTGDRTYFAVIFNICGSFDPLISELQAVLNAIPADAWGT